MVNPSLAQSLTSLERKKDGLSMRTDLMDIGTKNKLTPKFGENMIYLPSASYTLT